MTWSDEQYDELAEALEYACEKRIANGGSIGRGWNDCCPFGALLYGRAGSRRPWPERIIRQLPDVPESIVEGFTRGFDELERLGADPRAFALGRLFREQYVR